jgi:hypothetical protein
MSGARTFLSLPQEVGSHTMASFRKYVLLTAADGINCSFQLLVADVDRGAIKVQIASPRGKWWPVRSHTNKLGWADSNRDPVVLHGGIIHWLMRNAKQIISYDLRTRKLGSVKLPHTYCDVNQLQLATTGDGKQLKLLMIEGFKISVWLHVPISPASGSNWSLKSVLDMHDKLRSLYPDMPTNSHRILITFEGFSKRTGDVVFLWMLEHGYYNTITVFDLETKDMHTQRSGDSLLEIDLPSCLQNMKIFC